MTLIETEFIEIREVKQEQRQVFKTASCKGGGRNPQWHEVFEFEISSMHDTIQLSIISPSWIGDGETLGWTTGLTAG